MRKKSITLILCICIFLFGIILFIPNVVADSGATFNIDIYRIIEIDEIEGDFTGCDWYFYVGVSQDGSTYEWTTASIPMVNNVDDWYVPNSLGDIEFSDITTPTITFAILLLEEDGWPGSDDIADISSDSLGGWNDAGDPVPAGVRGGAYVGYYNLQTNILTGHDTIEELGYYKTSGEYDGNLGDENDAGLMVC